MVFDNSRENMLDSESMIEFLAYNMELCKRTAVLAGKGTDKMMLFMHMSGTHLQVSPKKHIYIQKMHSYQLKKKKNMIHIF
jgi:hypothetical protein